MSCTEYEKLLSALASASRVLEANQGELNAADIRMRCLVNITEKEARRALREEARAPEATEPPAPEREDRPASAAAGHSR